jgi:hypothetical protein
MPSPEVDRTWTSNHFAHSNKAQSQEVSWSMEALLSMSPWTPDTPHMSAHSSGEFYCFGVRLKTENSWGSTMHFLGDAAMAWGSELYTAQKTSYYTSCQSHCPPGHPHLPPPPYPRTLYNLNTELEFRVGRNKPTQNAKFLLKSHYFPPQEMKPLFTQLQTKNLRII